MALFQAKVGRKRPGKRENRNYCFITFLPNALSKILKKQQKIKKKYHYGLISIQNQLKEDEKERKQKLQFQIGRAHV